MNIFDIISYGSLFWLIISTVAMMNIFKKCGENPFKAIIPIYNLWVLVKMVGLKGWYLLIPLFNLGAYFYALYLLGGKFGKSKLFKLGLIFASPIFFLILGFESSSVEEAKANVNQTLMKADPSISGKVDLMASDPVINIPEVKTEIRKSEIKEAPSLEKQLQREEMFKPTPKVAKAEKKPVIDAFNMPLIHEEVEKIETLDIDEPVKNNFQKTQKICLDCGSPNDVLNKFCIGCGFNFEG